MTTYTPEQLAEILHLHAMWLRDEDGGKRANLSGADLRGTNLRWVDLTRADLRGTNLTRAELTRADLTGATLTRAELTRADLTGADLSDAIGIILGPQRSDGYMFWLTHDGADYRVRAGCRNFTFAEAREHWTRTRGGTPLGDETLAILDYLEARAPSMILRGKEAAE